MRLGCRFSRVILAALMAALFVGCTSLPSLEQRQASYSLSPEQASTTRIGQAASTLISTHTGLSGIYPLSNPQEAFAVRTLLADAAQQTLDVQSYIWRNDMTGLLLLGSLYDAADRGVRVRILLDDSANAGFDEILSALNAHDNIDVRLFNPLAIRFPRWVNYIVDFSRVNRRMHNKSFTADNQATIIGGRNIGDEYFGARADVEFSDLDVLAIGPVVDDVSTDFDRYWNSESAYPVTIFLPPATPAQVQNFKRETQTVTTRPAAREFVSAMRETDLVQELLNGSISLEWAPTKMLSDDPRKALGTAPKDSNVMDSMQRIFGTPESHMELVSSYFVPGKAGTQHLTKLARDGVSIRILTNSLASTDVAAVHAGYAKRRKPLLKAGIKLYEMRPQHSDKKSSRAAAPSAGSHRSFRSWRWGFAGSHAGAGPFGSGSSLHAKTLSIDGKRLFVGSFNFDPRSAKLNTELGFIIDSPELSQRITNAFMGQVPRTSYRVHLAEDGRLYWTLRDNGTMMRYDSEPEASLWRKLWVGFLSRLPIDWML